MNLLFVLMHDSSETCGNVHLTVFASSKPATTKQQIIQYFIGQPSCHQGNQSQGLGCPAFGIRTTWICFFLISSTAVVNFKTTMYMCRTKGITRNCKLYICKLIQRCLLYSSFSVTYPALLDNIVWVAPRKSSTLQ